MVRMRFQIALEFIVLFVFILFISLLVFGVLLAQRSVALNEQLSSELEYASQYIASQIDTAASLGNGYSTSIVLPRGISVSAYNITISKSGFILLQTKEGSQVLSAISHADVQNIVSNSTFVDAQGTYLIPTAPGSLTLQNRDGQVCIDLDCNSQTSMKNDTPAYIKTTSSTSYYANFSGSSYVSADSGAVNLTSGGNNTVTFWMYWDGQPSGEVPFGFNRYALYITNYCFGFTTGSTSLSTGYLQDDYGIPSLVVKNKLVFVAADFYNGAYTGESKLYINGVPQQMEQCAGPPSSGTASNNYQISGWPSGGLYYYGGIGNLQIYNTSLTENQINAIYQRGIGGTPINVNNLAAWYPFDGNTKQFIGSGTSGTLIGTITYDLISQINAYVTNNRGTPLKNALVSFVATSGNFSSTEKPIESNNTTAYGVSTAYLSVPLYETSAMVTATAFTGNQMLQRNLTDWWPLNLGTGNRTYDLPQDSGSRLFNTSWASPTQAINFDGSTTCLANSTSAPLNTYPNYLITAWIYLNSYTPEHNQAIYTEGNPPDTLFFGLTGSGNLTASSWNVNTPGYWVYFNSTLHIPLKKWTFVAAELTGGSVDNGIVTIFEGSNNESGPSQVEYNAGTHYSGIGCNTGYQARYAQPLYGFDGKISDVQIYNYLLPNKNITQIYSEGLNGPPLKSTYLVSWYPLDGDSNDYENTANLTQYGNIAYSPAYTNDTVTNSSQLLAANFTGSSKIVIPIQDSSVNSTSVSEWVYDTNPSSGQVLFLMGDNGGSNGYGLYLGGSPTSCPLYNISILESGVRWICTKDRILPDTWYNLILSSKPSGGGVEYNVYSNGALVYTSPTETNPHLPSNSMLLGTDNAGRSFYGYLSNLQVYGQPLTSSEAYQIYSNGQYASPIQQADPVGWWPLDGNANDTSGYGNNGTASGIAYAQFNVTAPTRTHAIGSAGLLFNGQNSKVSVPVNLGSSNVCNFTISAWSYDSGMESTGNMGGVFDFYNPSYADIEYNNNNLRFEVRNGTVPNSEVFPGSYKGRWIYTTLVLDNGQPYGYIDGQLVWDTSPKVGCLGFKTGTIGQLDRNFNGTISNLMVLKSALSSQDVMQLYQSQAQPYSSITVP